MPWPRRQAGVAARQTGSRHALDNQLRPAACGPLGLYRYATLGQAATSAVAMVFAVSAGAMLPLVSLVLGSLSGALSDHLSGRDTHSLSGQLGRHAVLLVYLAVAQFALTAVATMLFTYSGARVSDRIRELYLAAVVRQDADFFDRHGTGAVAARVGSDMDRIQEALSEKAGVALSSLAAAVTALVVGFARSWKLALVCVAGVVVIALVTAAGNAVVARWKGRFTAAASSADSVLQETLGSIHEAKAHNAEQDLSDRYAAYLADARRWNTRAKAGLALLVGLVLFVSYMNIGLALWVGAGFLARGQTDLSAVVAVLLGIIIGASSMGNLGPFLDTLATGLAAAAPVYAVIASPEPRRPVPSCPGSVQGRVELRSVRHVYPARPDAVVLQDVSLLFPAGQTSALVGVSGSGKSSIFELLQGFYRPVGGQLLLDGRDLTTLDPAWTRSHMAHVNQEPVLFAESVRDNILRGIAGTQREHAPPAARAEMVVRACKLACAHEFVSALPAGYDSIVGSGVVNMSVGQKQRLAIARALIREPKILLLDEATSALDVKTEAAVHDNIMARARGRTTIMIAHRLATTRAADRITVLRSGHVVEQGSFAALVEANGEFAALSKMTLSEDDKAEVQLPRASHSSDGNETQLSSTLDHVPLQDLSGTGQGLSGAQRATCSSTVRMRYILHAARPVTAVAVMGVLASIAAGCGPPIQGYLFARALFVLLMPELQPGFAVDAAMGHWSLLYLGLASGLLIMTTAQGCSFAVAGERLSYQLRTQAVGHLFRQRMDFFGRNSIGALATVVSVDLDHVAAIVGAQLGVLLSCSTTLLASTLLALAVSWKLALACTGAVAVMLAMGFLRHRVLASFTQAARATCAESGVYARQFINAVSTVQAFTMEKQVLDEYARQLQAQRRVLMVSNLKNSCLYAASQCPIFLAIAICFWYGGRLIEAGEYSPFQLFFVFSEMILGTQSAGTMLNQVEVVTRALSAVDKMLGLLACRVEDDGQSQAASPDTSDIQGHFEFRDVSFAYPDGSRILNGLSFQVRQGQSVALVGESGCGKSTAISLLERLYDPSMGTIYVDGRDVRSLPIAEYRRLIALISQEPKLYSGSVRYNLTLGLDSATKAGLKSDDTRLVQACRDANIHDFISSLPSGFETELGPKARLLSGGQKQRLAIARALLRDPKLLVLDEATSALDAQSEAAVQQALEKASRGRATIVIAHNLTCIREADCIYFMQGGRVVESGPHGDLMGRVDGKYQELVGRNPSLHG